MKPPERTSGNQSAAAPPRSIHARTGVGLAAHVLQGRELEILRVHVAQPALIVVDRGIKSVRTGTGAAVRALPGQAIVLAGNQTVDFTNVVADDGHYEARWLVFDGALLEDAYYVSRAVEAAPPAARAEPARLIGHPGDGLATAFERGRLALAADTDIPDAVARQRVLEVMHWLLEAGVVLHASAAGVAAKVRALIARGLDEDWTAQRVAGALAQSEATLRRRLAAEGTSLTALLIETRMATALTLLQATTQSVSDIALAVGYESQSRFAVRFRQRFGFAPTAVRGHERARGTRRTASVHHRRGQP